MQIEEKSVKIVQVVTGHIHFAQVACLRDKSFRIDYK